MTYTVRELPIAGSVIRIVDGFIEESRIREIHEFARTLPFQRIRYGYRDDPAKELSFGTQWVHGIAPDERARLPHPEIESLVRELLPEEQGLEPGRAHLSCIQPNDTRFPHIDDSTGRVITALYFVNSYWHRDWQGELVFYEMDEPLYAILPKPGRVIIFEGTLVHRGGVPSPSCPEVRYALACKLMRPAR
ncbi:2OG-Fe(II) oxygenase [Myxococcota bacterium]|nr:2OG-Fe(II) oxygenase [Myxococcota bacterium]